MKLNEKMYVIETNVDDTTGEIMGHALEKIGKIAVDAYIENGHGKKGRPVFILKAIANEKDIERVAEEMMKETGSLGVRVIACQRHIRRREITQKKVKVLGEEYLVRIKKSEHTSKPEYEDLKRIAEKTGIPLRKIKNEVEKQI